MDWGAVHKALGRARTHQLVVDVFCVCVVIIRLEVVAVLDSVDVVIIFRSGAAALIISFFQSLGKLLAGCCFIGPLNAILLSAPI